jgi:hypothetical protein
MQKSRAGADTEKLLAELAKRPHPTEEQINAWAAEDGDAWTNDELAAAYLKSGTGEPPAGS